MSRTASRAAGRGGGACAGRALRFGRAALLAVLVPLGAVGLLLTACGGSDPAKMADTASGYRTVDDPPPEVEQPLEIAGITLGRGIGPDARVRTPTDGFRPEDVIYASVLTRGGSGEHELEARWSYLDDAREVATSHVVLEGRGARTTELHVSRKKPWPAGTYRLELRLDGRPAGERTFTVSDGGTVSTRGTVSGGS